MASERIAAVKLEKRAIEIQPYASNVTFTINLLHSTRGIDSFNVIEGPSNGQELLHFFYWSTSFVHNKLKAEIACFVMQMPNHYDNIKQKNI